MRWLALCLLPALVAPATASAAGTIGREGTELVYRAEPGQRDHFTVVGKDGTLELTEVDAVKTTAGPGCEASKRGIGCSLAGVTAVRVLAGDGADDVHAVVEVPLFVDLGPGDDRQYLDAPSVTLAGGDGTDTIEGEARAGAIDLGPGDDVADVTTADLRGAFTLAGGDGDDRLFIYGDTRPDTVMAGGPGDDNLHVTASGAGAAIECGPGADRMVDTPAERPGDGCGAPVTGITPRTVSLRFREGRLGASSHVDVIVSRDVGNRRPLARGRADRPAGPLRVRLQRTALGRRTLERGAEIFVSVRVRTGSEVNEIRFRSRLG